MKILTDIMLGLIAVAFVVGLLMVGDNLRTGLEETEIYEEDHRAE